jgi:hypothetical protein
MIQYRVQLQGNQAVTNVVRRTAKLPMSLIETPKDRFHTGSENLMSTRTGYT